MLQHLSENTQISQILSSDTRKLSIEEQHEAVEIFIKQKVIQVSEYNQLLHTYYLLSRQVQSSFSKPISALTI